jgi:hypothetical protein
VTFDYDGYELKLIQTQKCKDGSDHLFTNIFKFYSPVTKYHYVLRAEFHCCNVFAIKFYCKKDRRSDFKYSKIINKGDLGNILMSCASVVPILLQEYPTSSFTFAASRSVDLKNKMIEGLDHTQRFRLYSYLIPLKFGDITFEHVAYDNISCYLLHNRNSEFSKESIEQMFKFNYNSI